MYNNLGRRGYMTIRLLARTLLCMFLLSITAAQADELVLHDGKTYSGKFIRGDAAVVEFEVLGRIESFKTADVSRIIFQEPRSAPPPPAKELAAAEPNSSQNAASVESKPLAPDSDQGPQTKAKEVPPQATSGPSVTFPSGTAITIRTTQNIDTDVNRAGDPFQATLEDPLTVGNQVIAPRGTEVIGKIAYARETGRVTGQSELVLELTDIKLGDRTYYLRTSDYSEVGSSTGRRTATAAGGGAALGAIIGAIAGGGKGAAVGAATGAAVGTGAAVLTRGKTLKIPAETILEFRLQSPLTVGIP
jgi:hypothetical protein